MGEPRRRVGKARTYRRRYLFPWEGASRLDCCTEPAARMGRGARVSAQVAALGQARAAVTGGRQRAGLRPQVRANPGADPCGAGRERTSA